MFRTILVLLFLAACGVYFHNNAPAPSSTASPASKTEMKPAVNDSTFLALKELLPAEIFEKDVKPVLEQNRSTGLTVAQLGQFVARLQSMGKELEGKAADAANKAAQKLEESMPKEKSPADQHAQKAGELAKNAGEMLKESLPAIKEISGDILSGMIAVLSQILSTAADLLKK